MKKNTFLWSCMLLMCTIFFVSNPLKAQVTLGASPYTQNFDAISAGLPTGWSVRTGANATTLGTDATFVNATTAWNTTTGNFRNVASATGSTGTDPLATQNAATNRALAIRQTGSFGDPGGAFVLQLANTTSKSNFAMTFKLQSLDVASARTTIWTVDYGIGAAPTTFTATTPTGTLTIGASTFVSNDITVNFGSTLDNQSGNVWIRIVALVGSTGGGSRATTGIDDVNLSWTAGGPTPTLVASPTTIPDFGSINNGSTSTNSSYTLTATGVTSDVMVTAPANFQVAKGIAGTYGSSVTYTSAELATVQTVGVRFAPTSGNNGAKTGNITHSGFATTVSVSGTEAGNVPNLSANPTTIADFGNVVTNNNSTASSYTLTGGTLSSDVIVTAPANFQVAKGVGGTYATTITFTAVELATAQIVGVRFLPTSGVAGVKSGNITHSGFTNTNVAVSGTEISPFTLPLLQPFNFTAGQALQTQTGFNLLNSGNNINITAGNLAYPNIPTPTGNKISLVGTGAEAFFDFTSQNANTVYHSFILNVTDMTGINAATGTYFAGFIQGGTTGTYGSTVWIKFDGTGYQIGINPRTTAANTVFTTGTPFVVGTPIFVVASYTFNAAAGDDVVKLWINPTLGQTTEPTATLQQTNTSGTDLTSAARYIFRQDAANSTPALDIDELRIGTAWADVTPIMTVTPTLVANPTTIPDFGTVNNGANSTASSYTLTATNLTNSVVVTAPANFQVAKTTTGPYSNTITYSSAELASVQTVGVRFAPTSGTNGVKSGNITHSGFATTTVAVSGTELNTPTLVANPTTIPDFGTVNNGANSTVSSYTLTATNLTNSVVVTAPANFQVAKTTTGPYSNTITYTSAELTSVQTVGVRFAPTSGTNGVKSGNITHSGFATTTVAVSGTEAGNGSSNINLFLGTNTSPLTAVANNSNINLGNLPFSTFGTTFTIQNTGIVNLTLGTITFSGTDGANATITSNPVSPVVPSGTTTFNVSYTPTSIGAKTVIFNLPNNDPNKNPYVVTMSFTIVAPMITVTQSATTITNNNSPAYNIGSVVVGNNLDATFTVTNTGNAPLSINTPIGITGTGFSIFTQPANLVANGANNTTTFVVRFNSASVTTQSGQITIANTSMNAASYVINITANATAAPTPTIALSQAATTISNNNSPAFNIGTTTVGTAITQTFTITNNGTAALSITNPLTVSGTGYSVTTAPATSVGFTAPNNTTTFVVSFNPSATGTITGTVTIVNGTGTNFVLNLTGTANPAPAPTIAVSQAATTISNNNSPAFNIGTTTVGTAITQTFTITNNGTAALSITNPLGVTGSAYSVTTSPATSVGFTAPNNTTTFVVSFNPSATGTITGTVTIVNGTGTNFVLNLTGTANPAPAPTIAVSQAGNPIANGGNFNMGTTQANVNNDKVFTITNGGNANLTITTPIGISGTGYSVFVQPTTPVAFGASNTTTFTVRFNSASVVTNAAGIVTIANNAGANYIINLTATTTTPTSPTLTILPTTLNNFGNVQTNQASPNQTYTILGSNLTANAVVTAPTNWDISKDGTLFTNLLSYTPSEITTAQTITVRFRPVSNVYAAKSGNITHVSTGATTVNIAVTGTEVNPTALENFSNDFIVSPNPAETFIKIQCDKPNRWQKAEVSFYNLEGKSTLNHTWEDATQTLQIDVKSWKRGFYILNIVEGNKIATKKIIVR